MKKERANLMNKKGQDLSIGTLILIVLGIIVLVLLILGFSLGWSNLWEKINIFKGSSSIGDIANACKIAVTSQDVYSYCQDFKKIKVNGQTEYINCLDSRVVTSLESKLDCSSIKVNYGNSIGLTPATAKCLELASKEAPTRDKPLLINGVSIKSSTECEIAFQ